MFILLVSSASFADQSISVTVDGQTYSCGSGSTSNLFFCQARCIGKKHGAYNSNVNLGLMEVNGTKRFALKEFERKCEKRLNKAIKNKVKDDYGDPVDSYQVPAGNISCSDLSL